MKIVETIDDLRDLRGLYTQSVAFIPTMGALHEGHASLIQISKAHCKHTIVSIFVNPTQFGPNEDFETYPRRREADLALLERLGVDIVFCPQTSEIYQHGIDAATRLYVPHLGQRYCGKSRPTFFEGVCSIVLRLFLIVNPTHAVFGEKDFQQVAIITRMIEDLYLPIVVIRAPIIREQNGLAMSSRNQYLTQTERDTAGKIYAILSRLKNQVAQHVNINHALQAAKNEFLNTNIRVDYLSIIDETTLTEVTTPIPGMRILFAGYVGTTRLIDNLALPQLR